MKKFLHMKKGFFALLLALGLGMGTAQAYNFSATYSGRTFFFNIIDATNHWVEITYPGPNSACPWCNYSEPTGNLTLPSTITYNGVTYTVKAIGNNVYGGCTGLTGSLTIPSTVTIIGYGAFQGCDGFTGSLTIGNSVTSIGLYA